MTDTQTKQFLRDVHKIAGYLGELVKETKQQNKLTLSMIQAVEASDAEEYEDYEDFREVVDDPIEIEEEPNDE